MKAQDLKELELLLNTNDNGKYNKKSIMEYGKVCNCDDGYLCKHRNQWILNWLKNSK